MAAPAAAWVPLEPTHVLYPEGSLVGLVCAYLHLAPLVIGVVLCTLIAFRRELETIALAVGYVLNAALCVVIKNIVRQARPGDKSSGYGMPSNHAQSLAFFAAYTALFCVRRAHFEWRITRWALIGAAVALAAAVCWSRVALHLHSAEQVVVGALVGAAAGAAWHGLLQRAVRPHYEWLEGTRLAELLLLRDSSHVRGVWAAEREWSRRARAAGRQAQRR